ncbi:lipocalin family protein [Anaerovorax odorimutans]|uniref:Lipocalin family protein n=1 Tax=Anaerovorax odorimutans TaxID=109327 RepID=A0ABT1RKY9_9FIRM|nr:lipocalin family protein [Anaerovorax odorimutans]MCQ4635855.1 lipocalin family protein [Anaerovorax odorimutans]
MYQMRNKAIALILAMVLCVGLSACGQGSQKKGGDTAIVGTWELSEIGTGSSKMSADDYMKSAEVSKVPALTFEDDGTVTLDVDGNSGTGTWLEESGSYSITYKSGDEEVKKDLELTDSSLKMEQDGFALTYRKK